MEIWSIGDASACTLYPKGPYFPLDVGSCSDVIAALVDLDHVARSSL